MKKLFLLALAMVALQAKAADTLTVRINGMRCSECGHKVKNILRKNPGVGALEFNYERRTVKMAYDSKKTCVDSIYSALARSGRYAAKPEMLQPHLRPSVEGGGCRLNGSASGQALHLHPLRCQSHESCYHSFRHQQGRLYPLQLL